MQSFYMYKYTHTYPRKNTYCPVKLSTFPLRCNKTNWGRIATASKYIENAQKICIKLASKLVTNHLRLEMHGNKNNVNKEILILGNQELSKTVNNFLSNN